MASCSLCKIRPDRYIIAKPVESQGKLGEVYLLLYFLDRVSLIPLTTTWVRMTSNF